ncbi:MAG TPA: adenylate kinase [Kiritimatiellia bacterium]|nr:adenylate kinase [Kiritimatiellia bacterium]
MDAIVLLGAPGSGKGTVAEDIRNAVNYQHVSTGDLLRAAIKAGSALGEEAKRYMERGELVPDEVIINIVKELIDSGSRDARYMFDGFPRTFAQAERLDEVLSSYGSSVKYVFLLEVARPVLVRRICGRRICRQCGAVYNIHTKRPSVDGVCDHCGSKDIYQRADDTEETLNNRLDVYERQTAELIDYYDRKKILVRVDAEDRLKTEQAIVAYLA